MIRVVVFEGRMTGHMHDISCKYDDSECYEGIEGKVAQIFSGVNHTLEQLGTKLIESKSNFFSAERMVYRVYDCVIENQYYVTPRFNCGLAVHEIVLAGPSDNVERVLNVIRKKVDYHKNNNQYSLIKDINLDRHFTGEIDEDIKLINACVR